MLLGVSIFPGSVLSVGWFAGTVVICFLLTESEILGVDIYIQDKNAQGVAMTTM